VRVVSVLPSATEIVCALGHGDELVGRSAECDYPATVRSLPVVMRPRTLDSDQPSRAIDARVQEVRSRGESLYELDLDLLRKLDPDVIFTQDLCGVCSVTDAEVAAACAKADVAPLIVSLTPRTLESVWRSVESVGRALDDADAGKSLARRLRSRARPTGSKDPVPRVAVIEWLDPPILAGLWTPDIVRSAGGTSPGVRSGRPGVRTDWATLAESDWDLAILSPCSFTVERTHRELAAAGLRAEVERLHPTLGTFVADEAYFSRPGPRLAEGIDLVRHLIARTSWEAPMPFGLLVREGATA
jgi:iron complex transport system substrate-binding protein